MEIFKTVSPYELAGNPIHKIGKEWMLVSAADGTDGARFGENYNTMTASWGTVGVLWGKPVAFVFIRPERHTFRFTEDSPLMSLSFFGGEMMKELSFCGRTSGRDTNKAAECALTPVFSPSEGGRHVYFAEASEVLLLRKVYTFELDPENLHADFPLEYYKVDGYHKVYVCEIVSALVREQSAQITDNPAKPE